MSGPKRSDWTTQKAGAMLYEDGSRGPIVACMNLALSLLHKMQLFPIVSNRLSPCSMKQKSNEWR